MSWVPKNPNTELGGNGQSSPAHGDIDDTFPATVNRFGRRNYFGHQYVPSFCYRNKPSVGKKNKRSHMNVMGNLHGKRGRSYAVDIGKYKAHLFLQAGDVREMLCDLGTK